MFLYIYMSKQFLRNLETSFSSTSFFPKFSLSIPPVKKWATQRIVKAVFTEVRAMGRVNMEPSYDVENPLNIQPSSCTLGHFSGKKDLWSHRNLYTNI